MFTYNTLPQHIKNLMKDYPKIISFVNETTSFKSDYITERIRKVILGEVPFDSFYFELVQDQSNNLCSLGFFQKISENTVAFDMFIGDRHFNFRMNLVGDSINVLLPEEIEEKFINPGFKEDMEKIVDDSLATFAVLLFRIEKTDEYAFSKFKLKKEKVRINGKNHFYRPEFIIVSNKKYKNKTSLAVGKTLDWKFSFPVRGHWRKIDSVGRDTAGNPILGKTWVKSHIRGDGDLDLRPRVVT